MAIPQKSPDLVPDLDIDQRRERIAAFVHSEQFASVQDLARLFGVSQVTIRNDIDALTQVRKDLRRVRGGVMRGQLPYAETPYEARSRADAEDKRAIGLAAAAMVQSNDTIILDVGTTTMAIAQALVERAELDNLTIFTNGLNIALALEAAYPRLQTVVTGGSLRPLQHSLVDPMAGLMLERIRAGIAFLGCNGVDAEFGVSTTNLPEATVKRMIMRSALRAIVVADASKFGRTTLARICAVDEVDSFLTAGHLDASCARQLSDLGIDVVNARPPTG